MTLYSLKKDIKLENKSAEVIPPGTDSDHSMVKAERAFKMKKLEKRKGRKPGIDLLKTEEKMHMFKTQTVECIIQTLLEEQDVIEGTWKAIRSQHETASENVIGRAKPQPRKGSMTEEIVLSRNKENNLIQRRVRKSTYSLA